MVISEATSATGNHHPLLVVLGDFPDHFLSIRIANHGSDWDVDVFVFAVSSMLPVSSAWETMTGQNVLAVLEMQQGPHLCISTQNHVSATAAVSSIRSPFRGGAVTVHVCTSLASFTRATTELHIINKILARHDRSMGLTLSV